MEAYVGCFNATGSPSIQGACTQCRHRKVRCDKGQGSCGNCERLSLECSYVSETIEPRGPRRLRGVRACVSCRESKVKCSGTAPRCSNCKRRGRQCVYPTLKRPALNVVSISSSSEDDESTPIIPEDMFALVDIFFEKIYPMPSFAFLHPATTKRRCRDGSRHKVLSLAICAVTALYSARDTEKANRWVEEAEQYIWKNLESPTIPRLQALLLIIHYCMEAGRFQRSFMLIAIAARSAAAMRLNHERQDLDATAKEVRRRIVWSLKITERYFSVGLPEFELCPFESIYLQLPGSEVEFSGADHPGDRGSYSLHVRLENIRRDIMKLTRGVALCEQPYPLLTKLIHDFEQGLSEISSMMPDAAELSIDRIASMLGNQWLPRLIWVQISWHQSHCDLFRLLLRGYPEAAPAVVLDAVDPTHAAEAEQHCLAHSMAIIEILTTLNQQSTSRLLLEFDIAICAYHAARLLLFLSRFGKTRSRPSPEFASSRADLCLAALKRFYGSSALVRPIIGEMQRSVRIFSHHGSARACPSSPNPNSSARSDPENQLSSAAKARQRLAIHSLLRQAEFSDGDDDDGREMATTHQGHFKDSTMLSTTRSSSNQPQSGQAQPATEQSQEFSPPGYNTENYLEQHSNQQIHFYDDSILSPTVSDQAEDLHFPFSLWFGQYDQDWLYNNPSTQ